MGRSSTAGVVQMLAQSPQHERESERHADGIDDYRNHDVRKPVVIRRARATDHRVDPQDLDCLVPVVGQIVKPLVVVVPDEEDVDALLAAVTSESIDSKYEDTPSQKYGTVVLYFDVNSSI